jgi:hypothetical protein
MTESEIQALRDAMQRRADQQAEEDESHHSVLREISAYEAQERAKAKAREETRNARLSDLANRVMSEID